MEGQERRGIRRTEGPDGREGYCRVTRRVRLLPVSAMYRLLAVVPAVTGNTATPHGSEREALVAGLLSPSFEPPPATVVIFFVLNVTLRIRLLPFSAMKTIS